MTRKDYELIASVIDGLGLDLETTDLIANKMAEALATTNPRFDRGRFIVKATRTHLTAYLTNVLAGVK